MNFYSKGRKSIGLKKILCGLVFLLCTFIFCGCNTTDDTQQEKLCHHSYRENAVSPTCEDKGYTTYTCVYCNDQYTASYTNPTGIHNYKSETVETTCTQKGYTLQTCTTCKKSQKTEESTSYARHIGSGTCSICGINYFESFVSLIKEKGKLVDNIPTISLSLENYVTTWAYYENENSISIIMKDLNYPNHKFGLSLKDSNGKYIYMLKDVAGVLTQGYVNSENVTESNESLQYIYTEYDWSVAETTLLLTALKLGMADVKLCLTATDLLFATLDHGMSTYNFGFIYY